MIISSEFLHTIGVKSISKTANQYVVTMSNGEKFTVNSGTDAATIADAGTEIYKKVMQYDNA